MLKMIDGNNINYHESEIIAMAWRDDVSFDAIERAYSLSERDVISLMRRSLKPASFKLWRKRVSGRKAKHEKVIKLKTRYIPTTIL